MAPATIVGRLIEDHSLTRAQRAEVIPLCEIDGRSHVAQASYGRTELEHMMTIFGYCRQKQPCKLHGKPLSRQPTPEQRFRCLEALLAIKDVPSCYDADSFRAFCRAELTRCAEEIIDNQAEDSADSSSSGPARLLRHPPGGHDTQTTVSVNGAPSPSRTNPSRAFPAIIRPSTPRASFSSQAVTPKRGRKPLPRTWNTFYIYHQEDEMPLIIEFQPILDPDGLSHVRFNHPRIRAALVKIFGPKSRPRFDMWNASLRVWVRPPKVTETQILLPGEGRVYRLRGLTHLYRLEVFKRLTLPAVDRVGPALQVSDDDDEWGSSDVSERSHRRSASVRDVPPPSSSPSTVLLDRQATSKGKERAVEVIELEYSDGDSEA